VSTRIMRRAGYLACACGLLATFALCAGARRLLGRSRIRNEFRDSTKAQHAQDETAGVPRGVCIRHAGQDPCQFCPCSIVLDPHGFSGRRQWLAVPPEGCTPRHGDWLDADYWPPDAVITFICAAGRSHGMCPVPADGGPAEEWIDEECAEDYARRTAQ
jgi:hypothetical protein